MYALKPKNVQNHELVFSGSPQNEIFNLKTNCTLSYLNCIYGRTFIIFPKRDNHADCPKWNIMCLSLSKATYITQ